MCIELLELGKMRLIIGWSSQCSMQWMGVQVRLMLASSPTMRSRACGQPAGALLKGSIPLQRAQNRNGISKYGHKHPLFFLYWPGHQRILPKSFLKPDIYETFSKDYMFLGCIKYISEVSVLSSSWFYEWHAFIFTFWKRMVENCDTVLYC